MNDEIGTDIGDNPSGVAVGKGINQTHQQANQRQRNDPSQNVNYYTGDGSRDWILAQINDHAQQIRELTYRLDDLPNKFSRLEVKVEDQAEKTSNQDERMKKLEGLEVIVSNQRVIVRPIAPPDAPMPHLNRWPLYAIIGFFIIIGLVSYLIWLQAVRGG